MSKESSGLLSDFERLLIDFLLQMMLLQILITFFPPTMSFSVDVIFRIGVFFDQRKDPGDPLGPLGTLWGPLGHASGANFLNGCFQKCLRVRL